MLVTAPVRAGPEGGIAVAIPAARPDSTGWEELATAPPHFSSTRGSSAVYATSTSRFSTIRNRA